MSWETESAISELFSISTISLYVFLNPLIVELKTTDFKPEYAGKLNFYLAAVDRQLKHPSDYPSIGMIICRTKNDLKVEYSLERSTMPMGVSEYAVNINHALPKELQGTLPTAAEIEAKLTEHRSEDILDRNEV